MAVRLFVCVTLLLGGIVAATNSALGQAWNPDMRIAALASLRVILPDVVRARYEGGNGRLRYGDGSEFGGDVLFSLAEVAMEFEADANEWAGLFLHVQHQPEDRDGVGIVSGYLEIEPPMPGPNSLRLRGGAMFPGVSRANRDVGWGNSYMLTNSPSHTWIGEDVRPIGVALGGSHRGDGFSLTCEGTAFFANDGSGAALALGGWALNDLKTPVTGEIRTFNPLEDSAAPAVFEPFREVDGRPGVQYLAQFDVHRFGGVSLLYWDNRGDTGATRADDVVWDTRFFAADAEIALPLSLIASPNFLWGKTRNPFHGTRFWSASALVARDFGRLRAAVRYDHFDQEDLRDEEGPRLDELGDAVGTTLSYSLGAHHRFAAELIHVSARRDPGATVRAGRTDEVMAQIEYRWMF